MSINADHLGAHKRGQEQFMKRLPIIRHIRAIILICKYVWRGTFIWLLTDYEQFENHPMVKTDMKHAREVWEGRG